MEICMLKGGVNMIAPKLRFKADDGNDFPELEAKSLFDICEYRNKQSVGKNYVGTENMKQNFSGLESLDEETEMKGVCYCKGDTLMSNIRPYLRKTWKADREGVCSTDVLVFHPIDVASEYLHYLIASDKFISYVMTGAKGVKMPRGDKEHMMKFSIMVPSLPEQQKIADFLSTIDTIIEKQQATVSAWEERKKGVMQKLFSQEVRFKADDGSDFPDWEEKKIEELIQLYDEKVASGCELPVLTSSKKNGIEYQEEHFAGKQRHDIDGYNVLPRNYCTYRNRSDGTDFTFNINRLCDKGIVSKFYPVFKENNCDLFFLVSLLNNEPQAVRKIAYTAKGTGQKVLSIIDLKSIMIMMPSLPEQQKIADCLSALDTVIQKQKETLEKWQELKKGLLQQMFV